MLLHWIWLAGRKGVSDWMKNALLEKFADAEDLYRSTEPDFAQREVDFLTKEAAAALLDKDLTAAWKILEDCMRAGISVLTVADPEYPQRLKAIGDAPAVLYYKGTLPDFDNIPTLALVGTRNASPYGLRAARRLGAEIAQGGGIVVSGLADGIDGAAMTGALEAGGTVVGVLGCGADVVYPSKNRELFCQTEHQGCILTQYAPGTPPFKWNFLERNRIISGLSCGTVVVEAPARSGALSTAKYARQQSRDVFAVPGNVEDPRFSGSNGLLRKGAVAAGTGADLLEEYAPQFSEMKPKIQEKPAVKQSQKKKLTTKPIDKAAKPPYIDQGPVPDNLSEEEKQVLQALGPGEAKVDDVIAQVGFPAGKTLGILTMLELKGIVLRTSGKCVSRKR